MLDKNFKINFHFELIFAICKGLNVFFRVEVDVCRFKNKY